MRGVASRLSFGGGCGRNLDSKVRAPLIIEVDDHVLHRASSIASEKLLGEVWVACGQRRVVEFSAVAIVFESHDAHFEEHKVSLLYGG